MEDKTIPTEEELRKQLTSEEYRVLREQGTERPFSGKYVHEETAGTYQCRACGQPLFQSDTKFDSGTGWPSFDRAIPGAIEKVTDTEHGMVRTEIRCSNCQSHLGHLFDDGPTVTGQRYCMNSVCLNLEEK